MCSRHTQIDHGSFGSPREVLAQSLLGFFFFWYTVVLSERRAVFENKILNIILKTEIKAVSFRLILQKKNTKFVLLG